LLPDLLGRPLEEKLKFIKILTGIEQEVDEFSTPRGLVTTSDNSPAPVAFFLSLAELAEFSGAFFSALDPFLTLEF